MARRPIPSTKVSPRLPKATSESNARKEQTYPDARAWAQRDANRDGFDRRLEWNEIFKVWMMSMLPAREHRRGFELRCEVVMCEVLDRCQRGHGPIVQKKT